MASNHKSNVLIIGATGKIGVEVLNGLIASENFNLFATVRPSSLNKPLVEAFRSQGVKIITADISIPETDFDALMTDMEIVVSTIDLRSVELQKPLIDAAKRAGVKRFIPSDWATPCVKGVRKLYDEKLELHKYIEDSGIGYTYIDVGGWMQYLTPLTDPAQIHIPTFFDLSHHYYGDGNQRTALIDGPDMGKFAALIIADPRTLNKYVFCYGDEKSQKEVWEIVEKKVQKELPSKKISAVQLRDLVSKAKEENSPMLVIWEYHESMWIRGDNTVENAKRPEYGGALDAKELYPNFKPKAFDEFVEEFYKST